MDLRMLSDFSAFSKELSTFRVATFHFSHPCRRPIEAFIPTNGKILDWMIEADFLKTNSYRVFETLSQNGTVLDHDNDWSDYPEIFQEDDIHIDVKTFEQFRRTFASPEKPRLFH